MEQTSDKGKEEDDWVFDDIFKTLGDFGRYQKIVYFYCSVIYVVTSSQLLGWVFVGAVPPHGCRSSPDEDAWNETESQCSSGGNQTTVGCELGYVWNNSTTGSSAVIEWDLVCDRAPLHATISAAPMFGYLFGGLLFGVMSDKFGRKPTFLAANTMLVASGLGCGLAPDYLSFTVLRGVIGAALAGAESACFVMGMELVGPSKRTLAGILCWFFETTGFLVAVTLAYLLNGYSWRTLQITYSLPGILFFSYIWLVPESLRWLVSHGRAEQARSLILKTAKINGVTITETEIEKALAKHEADESPKTYTMLDLFRHKNLFLKTCIIEVAWIVASAMYYVLLLDQTELSDSHFTGFLLTALIQLPGYVYVILTLERPLFGRKRSMFGFLVLSGICLLVHPMLAPKSITKVTVSMIGRFAANCSYTILNLYTAELYPTVVRGVGVGFSLVISRVGTILAPYILLIGTYYPLVFGFGALTAGALTLFLPETLGTTLPETIQDGEQIKLTLPCNQVKFGALAQDDETRN